MGKYFNNFIKLKKSDYKKCLLSSLTTILVYYKYDIEYKNINNSYP